MSILKEIDGLTDEELLARIRRETTSELVKSIARMAVEDANPNPYPWDRPALTILRRMNDMAVRVLDERIPLTSP